MKILITGVAGFIGYSLSVFFLKKKINILGIDNFDDYYSVNYKKKKGYYATDYYDALSQINCLSNYSDYYFIEAKHKNEWSRFWDNSKLLVLKKN